MGLGKIVISGLCSVAAAGAFDACSASKVQISVPRPAGVAKCLKAEPGLTDTKRTTFFLSGMGILWNLMK